MASRIEVANGGDDHRVPVLDAVLRHPVEKRVGYLASAEIEVGAEASGDRLQDVFEAGLFAKDGQGIGLGPGEPNKGWARAGDVETSDIGNPGLPTSRRLRSGL